MKTGRLFARLDRMPMLKALVPFAAGILLAERFTLPLWFAAGACVCAGAWALLLRSQACVVAMLLAAGFGTARLREREPAVPRGVGTELELLVTGIPAGRGRYVAAEGRIESWRDPLSGHWRAADDRVLLRADTLTQLAVGERLRCRGTVRPLRGGTEGYRRLMTRRGVVGTVYLSERALLERLPAHGVSLHARAARRIAALGVAGEAGAVVRAMVAGDRSGITPELRAVYARSGLAHLLAVSGLHTGIVFLVVNLLLAWTPLLRYGHLLRNLLAGIAVWLFAAAAGFPPSAVRAAAMCTCLQCALAAGTEYAGLNALAAAAFGMLLWNPAWLGDVGFRLSFVAVAAILAWGVPLCRRLRTGRRWLDAVTDAFAVGVAASLATAPLVAHTFGIIPLAGIAATPFALLPATLAVFAGALWLVLPGGFAAPPLRFVAGTAAEGVDALARLAASVPGGSVEYALSDAQTAAVYLLFVGATLAAWSIEPKKSVHLPAR